MVYKKIEKCHCISELWDKIRNCKTVEVELGWRYVQSWELSSKLCCDAQCCGVSLLLWYEGEVQAPQLGQVGYQCWSVRSASRHPENKKTSIDFLQWRQDRQWVAVERQSGQLPQPPEGVEDGPVGQLVTVEVEQPGGSIGVSSVSLSHLRHPSASSILQSYSLTVLQVETFVQLWQDSKIFSFSVI